MGIELVCEAILDDSRSPFEPPTQEFRRELVMSQRIRLRGIGPQFNERTWESDRQLRIGRDALRYKIKKHGL